MTSYVRTQIVNGEERSIVYDSAQCAHDHGENIIKPWRGTVIEFERYEFDETCANCGTEIPASV